MPRRYKLLLLTSLLIVSAAASAQIYTWKDETGRTVMSDKPPGGKAKAQKRGTAASPTEAAPPATPTAKPGVDPELDKRRKEQEAKAKAENAEKEKLAKAERETYCKSARGDLALLESGVRIMSGDATGERSYMDDERRAAETTRLRKSIADNCAN